MLAQKIKWFKPDLPIVLISGFSFLPPDELLFVDAHIGRGATLGELLETMRLLIHCHRAPQTVVTPHSLNWAKYRHGAAAPIWGGNAFPLTAARRLLAQTEVACGVARDLHRLSLGLGALVPAHEIVLPVGNAIDFVAASRIGQRVIGGRDNDNIATHFRMHIAEQWRDT